MDQRAPDPSLTVQQLLPALSHTHLDHLEEEAIFVLREVAASFERPALLFSGGKDSCVVLRLAEKAFKQCLAGNEFEGRLPLPLQRYVDNRVRGALIVVDPASNRTSGTLRVERGLA